MLIDPAVSLGLALPLAALLAASALHQARDVRRFAAAIEAYQLLPRGIAPVAAPLLIAGESAAAIGLLTVSLRQEAGLIAAALFVAYGAAIAFNLALGRREIDCGCHFGRGDSRISSAQIARNALLALASLAAAAPISARALGLFDFLIIALAALASAALYAAFEAVAANAAVAARGARAS